MLDVLASGLVREVDGDASTGYVLATQPRVAQFWLHLLGDAIADGDLSSQ